MRVLSNIVSFVIFVGLCVLIITSDVISLLPDNAVEAMTYSEQVLMSGVIKASIVGLVAVIFRLVLGGDDKKDKNGNDNLGYL